MFPAVSTERNSTVYAAAGSRGTAARRRRDTWPGDRGGLRNNISVGIQYLAAWLGGTGAVGIFKLMEDAATAEIARSQVWQWLHNGVTLDTGQRVTPDLVHTIVGDEIAKLPGKPADYERARATFV